MSYEKNPPGFDIDIRKGSLDREPDPKKRGGKRREDESAHQDARVEVIQTVNEEFGVEITEDIAIDSRLLGKLLILTTQKATVRDNHPTLDLVLSQVEERMDGNARWKKILVLGTIHYGWVTARTVIPGFSGLENISDGIISTDETKIFRGILNIVGFGNVSSILFEFLPRYIRSLGQ